MTTPPSKIRFLSPFKEITEVLSEFYIKNVYKEVRQDQDFHQHDDNTKEEIMKKVRERFIQENRTFISANRKCKLKLVKFFRKFLKRELEPDEFLRYYKRVENRIYKRIAMWAAPANASGNQAGATSESLLDLFIDQTLSEEASSEDDEESYMAPSSTISSSTTEPTAESPMGPRVLQDTGDFIIRDSMSVPNRQLANNALRAREASAGDIQDWMISVDPEDNDPTPPPIPQQRSAQSEVIAWLTENASGNQAAVMSQSLLGLFIDETMSEEASPEGDEESYMAPSSTISSSTTEPTAESRTGPRVLQDTGDFIVADSMSVPNRQLANNALRAREASAGDIQDWMISVDPEDIDPPPPPIPQQRSGQSDVIAWLDEGSRVLSPIDSRPTYRRMDQISEPLREVRGWLYEVPDDDPVDNVSTTTEQRDKARAEEINKTLERKAKDRAFVKEAADGIWGFVEFLLSTWNVEQLVDRVVV